MKVIVCLFIALYMQQHTLKAQNILYMWSYKNIKNIKKLSVMVFIVLWLYCILYYFYYFIYNKIFFPS